MSHSNLCDTTVGPWLNNIVSCGVTASFFLLLFSWLFCIFAAAPDWRVLSKDKGFVIIRLLWSVLMKNCQMVTVHHSQSPCINWITSNCCLHSQSMCKCRTMDVMVKCCSGAEATFCWQYSLCFCNVQSPKRHTNVPPYAHYLLVFIWFTDQSDSFLWFVFAAQLASVD